MDDEDGLCSFSYLFIYNEMWGKRGYGACKNLINKFQMTQPIKLFYIYIYIT